jgi:phasin
MTEATTIKSRAAKPAAIPAGAAAPKFEIPKFEFPTMEVPTAFREMAEKSVTQAKEAYDKLREAAEETTDLFEETYTTATKGASDYGTKMIEAARTNTNAAFDFARDLLGAKTFSEVIELSTAHARQQFESMTEQTKELTALAQRVALETSEPVKTGLSKAWGKLS